MFRASAILSCLIAGFSLKADILWNQPVTSTADGLVDQQFSNAPNSSSYVVDDITVGASGWTIDSLTEWFSPFGSGTTPSTIQVVFNVFNEISTTPQSTDDPTAGQVMTATMTADGAYYQMTVTGLGVVLTPGNYWIGITPIADSSVMGQTFYESSTATSGNPSAFRNPGGGFGLGTDWSSANPTLTSTWGPDGSLEIQGVASDAPEPGTLGLLLAGTIALGLKLRSRKH